jgi:hypothetical protein
MANELGPENKMSVHPIHPNGRPMSWQQLLDSAATESDVVAVVREFMATISPYESARLPESLRPRKITDANDVTTYAFDLVRGDVADNEGTQRALHRLAHFYSRASIRLAGIMAGRPLGTGSATAGDQRSA